MKTFRVFILVSIFCSIIVSCEKSNKDIIDDGDIRIWKYQDSVITNFEYWYFDAEGYWNVFYHEPYGEIRENNTNSDVLITTRWGLKNDSILSVSGDYLEYRILQISDTLIVLEHSNEYYGTIRGTLRPIPKRKYKDILYKVNMYNKKHAPGRPII